jgi:CRISPR-associated protein Cmr6
MLADLPPVPRQALLRQQIFADKGIPAEAHPGLVFERYFRVWENLGKPVSPKLSSLQGFVADYQPLRTSPHHRDRLAECHARLDKLVAAHQGITREFITQSRLAIGLGGDHPLENGFTFDYALGVPYLPGSSVKGLCRAWATLLLGQGAFAETEVDRFFGVGPDEANIRGVEPGLGALVFLAAYPKDWPELAVDVMTPHHMDYYGADPRQRGPRRRFEPMDTESPNPVYFLTVREQTRFVFRIFSRTSGIDLERGVGLLAAGLATLGIGAKTAVGYGVMQQSMRESRE